jgi:hypothetical protein
MQLELHGPVVLDRQHEERGGLRNPVVGEDDVDRARYGDDVAGQVSLDRDLDAVRDAVERQLAGGAGGRTNRM